MYVPPHFAISDLGAIHAFLRGNVFAVIAGHIGGTINFAYAPMVLDPGLGTLGAVRFHLALANPLSDIADGALVSLSVMGSHAYVSPDWYATDGMVPTWNYVAVEGVGHVRRLAGPELRILLSDLTAQEEAALAPKAPWKMARVPPERLDGLLAAIAGFELVFDRLEGKAKLSQNRAASDAQGVIDGLERRGDAGSLGVAKAMRSLYSTKRQ
ncbi:MAG TPA: FMN-binding negative transcriptional regulator [Micropepsaceae bacterium]|jgi:transcriptional regulator|nr:FMN-binding negative transcriptional regulator [Micropepsaceae bacterium]